MNRSHAAANSGAIRNCLLPGDPQSNWEKLAAEISRVDVGDAAEHQLGAGIEKLDVHSQF
jgi:hypothetical protein